MRTLILAAALLLPGTLAFAQSDQQKPIKDLNDWKLRFGFAIAPSYSLVSLDKADWQNIPYFPPSNITATEVNNNPGFGLAVSADHRFLPFLIGSVQPTITFSSFRADFKRSDNFVYVVQINQPILEFPVYLQVQPPNMKNAPTIGIGAAYKRILYDQASSPNANFWALDFRIGLEHLFSDFFFAPELRYSHALTDVYAQTNERPVVGGNSRQNQISLVLNFKG